MSYTMRVLEHTGRINMDIGSIKHIIANTISCSKLKKFDMYKLNGAPHNFLDVATNYQRFVVFINGTRNTECSDVIKLEESKTINGIANNFKVFLHPHSAGQEIVSPEGVVLAVFDKQHFSVDILFDLFGGEIANNLEIFQYIMSKVQELVFEPIELLSSWKHTSEKEQLIKTFSEGIRKQQAEERARSASRIATLENDIKSYMRTLKQRHDELRALRLSVVAIEKNDAEIIKGLIDDMDLIINNEQVKDLRVEGSKFIVTTNDIIIESDKGKRYFGGEYTIEIEPKSTEVKFFGNNRRRSYWTDNDPHPHVNGNTGDACLGNVSSTIAELCSQMQLYALTLICIDFLKSANTADPAGKNVINWDSIDDDGNITPARNVSIQCPECDEYYEEDQLYIVYNSFERFYYNDDGERIDVDEECDMDDYDEIEYEGEHMVCANCRCEYYHYSELAQAYIRD